MPVGGRSSCAAPAVGETVWSCVGGGSVAGGGAVPVGAGLGGAGVGAVVDVSATVLVAACVGVVAALTSWVGAWFVARAAGGSTV